MRSSPTQIGSGTNWSSILELQNGGRLSGAIKTDGTLWTWGANDQGQLGHNDRVTKSSPTQVAGATWLKVAISYKNSLFGIKTNGTLWSWGQNQHGQLGQNDAVLRSSPVQIGTGTTWTNVFGGDSTVLAQTSN
jgi:alpha-tubulin suppressor-like RCC1 family protein